MILDGKVVTYLQSWYQDVNNTLLFLHGWMQNKESFNEILKLLDAEKIAYMSLDLPWFWGTWLVSNTMQIEDYGVFVRNFIEKKGLKSPLLIGHSFGWRISIYLGSFYKNISAIFLIGSAGIAARMNPIRLWIVKVGKIIFSLPWLSAIGNYLRTAVSWEDYKNAGNMTQIYRNTISNDLRKYMKQITLPVCLVFGKDDDQVPLEEAKLMHQSIPESKLEILEGTHFIHQEKPKEITELLLSFIQK